MVESLVQYVAGIHAAFPLDESLLPVLRVALALAFSAVSGGLWVAWRLVRGSENLQAACRLHDWLEVDGHYICTRCAYEAGSPRRVAPPR
jgi:hypothetical protein